MDWSSNIGLGRTPRAWRGCFIARLEARGLTRFSLAA
jgi:hypothetical protein